MIRLHINPPDKTLLEQHGLASYEQVMATTAGELIDEDALISALSSGKLFAAGLDCFQTEPGANPKMSGLKNLFMLPHIGSATVKTRDAMGFRALDNLDAFFAGKTPRDLL